MSNLPTLSKDSQFVASITVVSKRRPPIFLLDQPHFAVACSGRLFQAAIIRWRCRSADGCSMTGTRGHFGHLSDVHVEQ